MTLSLLSIIVTLYRPELWQYYPSMKEIRSIAVSSNEVYVAVPDGVYVLDGRSLRYARCLTAADGLGEEVRFCAWNPVRPELLTVTSSNLYSYLPQTGLLRQLRSPPGLITAIGTSRSGVWLVTERGTYLKHATLDEYTQVDSAPAGLEWQGAMDRSSARDYNFLTPYFFTDEQLIHRSFGPVRKDQRRGWLYVAINGYGLGRYDLRSGLLETTVRLGPVGPVTRILRVNNSLWLIGPGRVTVVDSSDQWLTLLLARGLPMPLRSGKEILELAGSLSGINDFVSDSGRIIFATQRGLHSVSSGSLPSTSLETGRPVLSLLRTGDSLFVGTDQGLYLLQGDSLSQISDPTGRADWGVYSMLRSADGTTWFATLGGLVRRLNNGVWERLAPPGINPSAPVTTAAAADTRLFFGYDGGIGVYNTDVGNWDWWDKTDGVPSGPISALFAENGKLWIATLGIVAVYRYESLR